MAGPRLVVNECAACIEPAVVVGADGGLFAVSAALR